MQLINSKQSPSLFLFLCLCLKIIAKTEQNVRKSDTKRYMYQPYAALYIYIYV